MTFAAILLDVDGTLVRAGGAGRAAFEGALAELCGPLDGQLAGMRFDGMTDRLIALEALARVGLPAGEAAADRLLGRYVELLAGAIHRPGFQVLPGVVALLEARAARGLPLGLCTGNVAAGARIKLAHGRLDRFFDWSPAGANGFAEDGVAREEVVAAALRRVAARLGRAVAPAEVLVVGDTPRDVSAAHAAGCPALGVATGSFDVAALAAAGADLLAEALEALAALAALLPPEGPGVAR